MPAKGKKKAVPEATEHTGKGPHTRHQQYQVEQRIWTDISNAMYEASARVEEWIKEGGEKQDKRIWAAVEGIKAYTMAYVTAEKERLKGTVMEELRGNRAYEMLTTRAQQLSDDLGMTNATEPSTYAEAATQYDELDEITESQRERMATMEREYERKLEVISERAVLAVADRVATAKRECEASLESRKREHETEVEVLKAAHHIDMEAHDTTRKNLATMEARLESMEMMRQEHEAEVEALKERVETSHHIYTEAEVQTEEALDETTALPEYTKSAAQTEEGSDNTTALPEGIPKEIPTREEGGREASATKTDDSWALDKITALPEEIQTRNEEGRKSYAQAASQGIPITIAPPQLMPAAHTISLDDWKPYEDLSGYEKEDSGYESGGSGSNWRRGRRRERTEKPTPGSRPYAQAVVIHGIPIRYKLGKLGRWIQEDNTGIEVMGVRWLLSEDRRGGKEASSLVIYTKSAKEIAAMRLGGRFFSTEKYDWNRGHPRQDRGI